MTSSENKNVRSLAENSSQDAAYYMSLALEEANKSALEGEVPVGAVVVYEPIDKGTRKATAAPRIVGIGRNRREADKDATAHAELLAMKDAMRELDAWRLADCTVYVTLEPCIMCAGLMQQARIARCVYGASDPKGGALNSLYHVGDDPRLNHSFEVVDGVMEEDCSQVLSDFFKQRRKRPQ